MSKYDELERLARLKEQGILSEEEFQAQKKKLLDDPAPAAPPEATSDSAPQTPSTAAPNAAKQPASLSTPPEKRKANLPVAIALIIMSIIMGAVLWNIRDGNKDNSQLAEQTADSLLATPPDTAGTQQPSAELSSSTVDMAVEDMMIRQIRRSELDGLRMRKGEKLQIERGDLDRDGDDDVVALFSLTNTETGTFVEHMVALVNDGTGKLRLAAEHAAGRDDQAQGTSWNLKGITNARILVAVSEWSETTNAEGVVERRDSSTVRELKLSGSSIVDL